VPLLLLALGALVVGLLVVLAALRTRARVRAMRAPLRATLEPSGPPERPLVLRLAPHPAVEDLVVYALGLSRALAAAVDPPPGFHRTAEPPGPGLGGDARLAYAALEARDPERALVHFQGRLSVGPRGAVLPFPRRAPLAPGQLVVVFAYRLGLQNLLGECAVQVRPEA
jgi:hypothetical protein